MRKPLLSNLSLELKEGNGEVEANKRVNYNVFITVSFFLLLALFVALSAYCFELLRLADEQSKVISSFVP